MELMDRGKLGEQVLVDLACVSELVGAQQGVGALQLGLNLSVRIGRRLRELDVHARHVSRVVQRDGPLLTLEPVFAELDRPLAGRELGERPLTFVVGFRLQRRLSRRFLLRCAHRHVGERLALFVGDLSGDSSLTAGLLRERAGGGHRDQGGAECKRLQDSHDPTSVSDLKKRLDAEDPTALRQAQGRRTSCLKDETAGRLLQNGRRRTMDVLRLDVYFAKRSKISTSSDNRFDFSGSPFPMPSGTHRST
jgi:hypothetical protein